MTDIAAPYAEPFPLADDSASKYPLDRVIAQQASYTAPTINTYNMGKEGKPVMRRIILPVLATGLSCECPTKTLESAGSANDQST